MASGKQEVSGAPLSATTAHRPQVFPTGQSCVVAREFAAALEELRMTKLECLNYKSLVTHDRAQLAEIARDRMLVQAQPAERDPTLPRQ